MSKAKQLVKEELGFEPTANNWVKSYSTWDGKASSLLVSSRIFETWLYSAYSFPHHLWLQFHAFVELLQYVDCLTILPILSCSLL